MNLNRLTLVLLPLILATVSGCKMTASASAKGKVDNVEVEAKVVVESQSQSDLFGLFAPELFEGRVLQLSSIDASSLEFEINNIYNVTEIQNNSLSITLTSNGQDLIKAPFSVFKEGSSYKLSAPNTFSLWAKPYENIADGFKLNLTTVARQIQNPSKFTISSKYNSFEFLETAPLVLEGCDLPEFPVPDPSQYCNY